MTSDLSTDKAQASGGRSFRDVALEVPNFVDVVVAKSQCVYPSATNPCCERVGKEEQFSTVLQESAQSCQEHQQTEAGGDNCEQFGALEMRKAISIKVNFPSQLSKSLVQ